MARTDRSKGRPDHVPQRVADRPDAQRQRIVGRKEKFQALNDWINRQGGAWLTSIPGDFEVRMECLPSSDVPQRLGDLGFQLRPEGRGERILACAIVDKFCRRADGELEPLTEGSTMPVARLVTHAGIVEVVRFSFVL
jgi:hypothetical protein